jgi:hypothetical protein
MRPTETRLYVIEAQIQRGLGAWPTRSPDFTVCDCMKYRTYDNDKPRRLVACVIEAAGDIRKAMGHF